MAQLKQLKDAIYTPELNTPEEIESACKIMDNYIQDETDTKED